MRLRRGTPLLLALAFAAPFAGAAASCTDLAGVELSAACSVNSDCTAPLVCAFQLCHQQCTTTRDCPTPQRCVAGDGTGNVCQAIVCSYNSQCPGTEVCAVDGQCRDQCVADRDCIAGQVCTQGVCADPSELVDGGLRGGDAGAGLPCQLSSDCGDAGLVCRNGACQVQCRADIDCVPPEGPGGVCIAGVCVTQPPPDAGSDAPADAPADAPVDAPVDAPEDAPVDAPVDAPEDAPVDAPADAPVDAAPDAGTCSKACTGNAACDDGVFCNGQEVCANGCCAPPVDTPCDSHQPCIVDACDESTKTCTHTPIAVMDADGDGHMAKVCGGDDCNDLDPTVYAGHPESFDGKDNDCNGFIDDGTAEPKGPPSGALAGSAGNCQLGAPVGGGPGGWVCANLTAGTSTLVLTPYDAGWMAGSSVSVGLPAPVSAALDVASAGSTVAFAVATTAGTATTLRLVVLQSSGALAGTAVLDANFPSGAVPVDVTWTGQAYLVGWSGSNATGYFAQVDASGNVLGMQKSISTSLAAGSPVAVAGNGTSVVAAYQDGPSGHVMLELFSAGGGMQATSDLGAGTVFAVAGAPNAYVVLAQINGKLEAIHRPVSGISFGTGAVAHFPVGAPSAIQAAKGASDGAGAAFLMQLASGVWFGYLNGSVQNPFELDEVQAGATLADIAGNVGRLGVFYTVGGQLFGRQAGSASLSGADCAVNADCASGVCTPVVPTGPGAYSICQ